MSTITLSRIDQKASEFTDRLQAKADDAAELNYQRGAREEDGLMSDPKRAFSEVLEELAGISDADKAEFMQCIADADRGAVSTIFMMIERAKERVIARRLAEGV